MESELICLDTSVLIDYFRKTQKANSFLFKLTQKNYLFAVSVITEFEILYGSNQKQKEFWEYFFLNLTILPFESKSNIEAVEIFKYLRKEGKLIDMPDLFIGATAKANNLKLATLNEKHFKEYTI